MFLAFTLALALPTHAADADADGYWACLDTPPDDPSLADDVEGPPYDGGYDEDPSTHEPTSETYTTDFDQHEVWNRCGSCNWQWIVPGHVNAQTNGTLVFADTFADAEDYLRNDPTVKLFRNGCCRNLTFDQHARAEGVYGLYQTTGTTAPYQGVGAHVLRCEQDQVTIAPTN